MFCRRVFGCGWSGGWLEGDGVSLCLEFDEETFGLFLGVEAGGEVVGAEVLIGAAGSEDVPDDDGQFVGDDDDGLLLGLPAVVAAELADVTVVEGLQIAVGTYGGPGALDQPDIP